MKPNKYEEDKERVFKLSMEREDFVVGDDGYYVYWPKKVHGFLNEYYLLILADVLADLNRQWDQIVQNDPAISGNSNDI